MAAERRISARARACTVCTAHMPPRITVISRDTTGSLARDSCGGKAADFFLHVGPAERLRRRRLGAGREPASTQLAASSCRMTRHGAAFAGSARWCACFGQRRDNARRRLFRRRHRMGHRLRSRLCAAGVRVRPARRKPRPAALSSRDRPTHSMRKLADGNSSLPSTPTKPQASPLHNREVPSPLSVRISSLARTGQSIKKPPNCWFRAAIAAASI